VGDLSSGRHAQYILGQILARPESLPIVLRRTGPEDFRVRELRRVFEACVALAGSGRPLDSQHLWSYLWEQFPDEPIADRCLLQTVLREARLTFMADRPWPQECHGE